ncbi:unnamed protein product [Bursaphelenchus xylophilus]|uniref:(pine wood nematode) hypothetical protein n=1 Tax=Bursaphelenchus xylophilus TaxID=6326 RepID=A0A1I7RY59_BURXY|nr:unnamed protein product [Bursaphelenchus xylophilus]CAD5209964.1 unnamed protein product [Bursaphelenchus xylophilus]CAG9085332.1 unnamed protein product [Bursaphelenchus xylophilus]CAG9085460.1 unnamed protein product [Bursaphelenchus xylophilus]
MSSLKQEKTKHGMKVAFRALVKLQGHLKFSKFKMVNKDFMEKIEMDAVDMVGPRLHPLNGVIKFGMRCISHLFEFAV